MSTPAHHNVAIVTGAAGGLGSVIARRLARENFHVVLTDTNETGLARAASQLDGDHVTALLDVRRPEHFRAAIDLATRKWGGVGVLVNNAALTKTTPLFEITPDEFDAVTAIALKGTFIGCQVLGEYMRRQRYGRIINMASLAGQNGGAATGGHYAAAKGGILTLTKVFARELAADGVTVNAISPGPLDLDSVRELLPPERLAAVVKTVPSGTLGDPDYVARLVSLLAAPQAVSAVGATFDINGGLYLR
jgi:3-oxoacyl-[acyl-carrier protein] reductase